MKIVTFGKKIENNKITRYALIMMKLDRKTRVSVDNTITYVYSNDINYLLKTKHELIEVSIDKPHELDICIYDYQKMHYVRGY